ncbi:hypothetical protein AXG93_122s1000 [Marchantia polymorpha subsp. ruderalis]|uniref:Uncharacterized protein n=1 Tax=Marchantia polymorpha subsp. ruderalis TaxID=1480154 RepID=A0A176VCV3_MARPO|nr:hypothetical protein AXG93_122s1000 [Marchantia polymorpha subsp. ruderalis]
MGADESRPFREPKRAMGHKSVETWEPGGEVLGCGIATKRRCRKPQALEFPNAAVVPADESRINHELAPAILERNRSAVLRLIGIPNAAVVPADESRINHELAPAILERNRSAVPASHRNCSALRGVRKLLIVNMCGACAMADIHVACGAWASATASVFTRLGYNDCLVNSGQPVSSHGGVSFQYSSSAIAIATNECSR